MARQKLNPPTSPGLARRTLILDNGGWTIKAGFCSHLDSEQESPSTDSCSAIQNTVAYSQRDKKTYIASQIDNCDDFGEVAFRRPVEKGFVVNWESEKAIWEHEFFTGGNEGLGCDPSETNLILTEAPHALVVFQRYADEMVFEEFGFKNYLRTITPVLNAYAPSSFSSTSSAPGVPAECLLVVDAGYSHTTVTPLFQGRPLHPACRRLDIGGKTLTNHLKDLVSTRQFELRKEDWMANQIKEDVCFVSQTFDQDLERVWKGGSKDRRTVDHSIVVDYVLPDYEDIKQGFARPHDPSMNARKRQLGIGGGPREDLVVLVNERFTVPEILFTPSDVGMQSEGVVGTILQSTAALPEGLRQAFLANVLVVGGTSKLPGFTERLETDLRSRLSNDVVLRVKQADDPIKNVWLGGARLAQNEEVMKQLVVSREEYLENGDTWVRRKFAGKVGR